MLTAPTSGSPLVLLPVQPAPLPFHYRFHVQVPFGVPKHKVVIDPAVTLGNTWPLADQDVIEACGFSKLLRRLLQHANQNNLWGQTIQLRANYVQPNNVVLVSTRSEPQSLQLPLKPILVNALDKVSGVANQGYPSLPAPQGRRLFWTQLPGNLGHNAWFVGADNRLAPQTGVTGFDRFSFWLSALGIPIKSSAGIQTGEAFATAIKATRLPTGVNSPQATVAQIVAAAGANAWIYDSCIFWTSTRLLFYTPGSGNAGFREYGASGLAYLTLAQFSAGQSSSSVWNLGRYPHQPMAYGLPSVA